MQHAGRHSLQVLVHPSVGTGGLHVELYVHCHMNRSIILLSALSFCLRTPCTHITYIRAQFSEWLVKTTGTGLTSCSYILQGKTHAFSAELHSSLSR